MLEIRKFQNTYKIVTEVRNWGKSLTQIVKTFATRTLFSLVGLNYIVIFSQLIKSINEIIAAWMTGVSKCLEVRKVWKIALQKTCLGGTKSGSCSFSLFSVAKLSLAKIEYLNSFYGKNRILKLILWQK